MYRKMQSLGLLKPLLLCASQLSRACVFSHSPSSSVLSVGSSSSWRAAREQTMFLLGNLHAQKFIPGGAEPLMAVTALFTDMNGSIPFLTCHIGKQRIPQSSSHYSHSRWWTLRELRLETNGQSTAKPSASAATPSVAPWEGLRIGKAQDTGPRSLRKVSNKTDRDAVGLLGLEVFPVPCFSTAVSKTFPEFQRAHSKSC